MKSSGRSTVEALIELGMASRKLGIHQRKANPIL